MELNNCNNERLMEMAKEAYAKYYKAATRPCGDGNSEKSVSDLTNAAAEYVAINEELSRRFWQEAENYRDPAQAFTDIFHTKGLWMRVGVTVNLSEEEVSSILGDDFDPIRMSDIVRTAFQECRYTLDGDTYVPETVVANYNEANGTHFSPGEPECNIYYKPTVRAQTVNVLGILDRMDEFRRTHKDQPSDYCMRFMEAILAEAAGYKGREVWTEKLKADKTTKYHAFATK